MGFKKSNDNKSYVLIQELCDKNIEQFFGNYRCLGVFFARNATNTIYSWGKNHWGQLGRGFESKFYENFKPKETEFFSDKNIIQISCGWSHCLALSSDDNVYGWGKTRFTTFDINSDYNSDTKMFITPIVLTQLNESIKSIHCYNNDSYSLTFNGKLFCYTTEKYMDWEIPGQIIDIINYEVFCQTNESVFVRNLLLENSGTWIKIDQKNLFQYFINRFQITYKTIDLINNEMFSIDFYLSKE